MIAFRQVALRRGPRELFADLNGNVHDGWKLAVTGRNGTGKSSLFGALRGELDCDRGSIDLPAGLRIAAVAQEMPAPEMRAGDHVLAGDGPAAAAVLAAEHAEASGDHAVAAQAHQRMQALRAYDARARVGRLLHGLGFAPGAEQHEVREFSGGWRARLNLARALMAPSDLLLLDEPTNHLDLDAMLWLEQWLREYPGILMVISHDREFLDAIADHVLHLEAGGARFYAGNYSAFERQRAEQLEQQQGAFEREQAERAHLQSFIDRFRAKATKARQAQARIKRLERLAGTEAVRVARPLHFRFPAPERIPEALLGIVDGELGYPATEAGGPARPVLGELSVSIRAGDRIGLLGVNGAGKTTLIRGLVDELALLAGRRTAHRDLVVGYFAQHVVESLQAGSSPFEHLRELAPDAPAQALRDWLGQWQLGGDRAFDPVEHFSGGERARLALALVAWRRPNLLVLDEPTNHLDMDMREALAEALNEYGGALLLVAHDRHLLGLACDEFWHVAQGQVRPFDGDLEDYAAWARQERREAEAPQRTASAGAQAHAARRQRRNREQQLGRLETRMTELGRGILELEEVMGRPETWQRPQAELAALREDLVRLQVEHAEVEERWLELAERLESAEESP